VGGDIAHEVSDGDLKQCFKPNADIWAFKP
jgi:hypothetical protein